MATPLHLVVNPSLRLRSSVELRAGRDRTALDLPLDARALDTLLGALQDARAVITRSLDLDAARPPESPLFSAEVKAWLEWAVPGRGLQSLVLDFSDEHHRQLVDVARTLRAGGEPLTLADLDADDASLAALVASGLALEPDARPADCTWDVTLRDGDDLAGEPPRPPAVHHRGVAALDSAASSPWRSAAHLPPGTLLVPYSGVALPVALSPEMAAAWAAMQAGQPIAPGARSRLASAGFVERPDALDERAGADALARDQHAVLRNLISPFHVERLRRHWLSLVTNGWLGFSDSQAERWYKHNEPTMMLLHRSIEPLISRITSRHFQPCRASYSYLTAYRRGSVLPRHKDRPQCRWNVSICLGSEPDAARWPIFLETERGVAEIALEPGDGLLYSGTELWHWRDHFVTGQLHGVCLFHFVDLDAVQFPVSV